jgi:hypothetical protein
MLDKWCVDRDAIVPLTWGPALWRFLHTLAYQLDASHLPGFGEKLVMLLRAIPCDACRAHALQYVMMNRLPPRPSSRDIVLYMQAFHNAVNQRLSKPQYTLSKGARAHANWNLRGRASDIALLLRRALPRRCTLVPPPSDVELSRFAAQRRVSDIIHGIALIEAIGGLRHRAAYAPKRRTHRRSLI